MGKVYVIMDQKVRDRATGELVSKFDFSTAEEYGELVFLLAPNAVARDPKVNGELCDALKDFSDDDYLLPVGSPTLILLTGAYASFNPEVTRFNVLEWERDRDNRDTGRYLPTTIELQ